MNYAIPEYIEQYGIDPSILLNEHHLSDEVSGPDTDSEEMQQGWEDRMAICWGLTKEAARKPRAVKYHETIQPRWRSSAVSFVLFFSSFQTIDCICKVFRSNTKTGRNL